MVEAAARDVVRWCRRLAQHSDSPDGTTRVCCSDAMRRAHADVSAWMARLGLTPRLDAAGNLRGLRRAIGTASPRLFLGSHLDTVPDAGAFDGVLGVVWALALVELLRDEALAIDVEVVGFSDEEGVRFGAPFIGSRGLAGSLDDDLLARTDADGVSVRDALIAFGARPDDRAADAAPRDAIGYLECHIEQGPVLEHLDRPLGIVDAIIGQTRAHVTFTGRAGHAGTTPMTLRHDALAGAAAWILAVEQDARAMPDAVATTGRIDARPGAVNVIAGDCRVSLDVRHGDDATRHALVARLRERASVIARDRGLTVDWTPSLDQASVAMDPALTAALTRAAASCGLSATTMPSGAGHDAMVVAGRMPAALLFVRSPGGISHHPDESVREEDVAAALAVGRAFVLDLSRSRA